MGFRLLADAGAPQLSYAGVVILVVAAITRRLHTGVRHD